MKSGKSDRLSRRDVVRGAAIAAAATTALPYVVGCGQDSLQPKVETGVGPAKPAAPKHLATPSIKAAKPGKPLKIGLIGCGGRGTDAGRNAIDADKNVKIVALADVYKDRLEGCRGELKKKGAEIEDKHCFLGLDAYKKLLELDLDYVILATPPYYRPEHLSAAIAAGKHVFTEKPVGVDPVGLRMVLAAGKMADAKKLSVVAGTQRRHENKYLAMMQLVHGGEIGRIRAAQCYWNGGQLWYKLRQNGWSDSEWMHRDWVNWCWLSGDHIVEQHVHNLDIVNWAIKSPPRKAVAMGGRARRVTGDQFDFFSADLSYPDPEAPDKESMDIHVHSMCRQVNGCVNNVSERIIGEKGIASSVGSGWVSTVGKLEYEGNDPYVQEHMDLINAIRTGKRINEAENVATSTMTAVMIRMSAYTGKEVSWDDVMESDLKLGPPTYELVEAEIRKHVPIPGQ